MLLMAILTVFTAILLVDRRPGVGPIIVTLSEGHGIHAGDLPVVALWIIGLVCGVMLLRDDRSA